jgi:hypothetical protein
MCGMDVEKGHCATGVCEHRPLPAGLALDVSMVPTAFASSPVTLPTMLGARVYCACFPTWNTNFHLGAVQFGALATALRLDSGTHLRVGHGG